MPLDISRDFVHLSQTLSVCNEPFSSELVVILENCTQDQNYRKQAMSNLIAYASKENRVKEQLKNLAASSDQDVADLQPIADEILRSINNKDTMPVFNNPKNDLFKNPNEALDEKLSKLCSNHLEQLCILSSENQIDIKRLYNMYENKLNTKLREIFHDISQQKKL